ncbi:efflux RND transporter periplasmic adaptor subunit [Algoriphagus formosus]|uniref:efflux RND transporter periplasmic adaptor subunit n=1 Tax=Algoriphagus formosus TaxID=2007308 RepID=UPI003F7306B5
MNLHLRKISFILLFPLAISCQKKDDSSEGIEVEAAEVAASSQIQLSQSQFNALKMEWGSIEARNLSEQLSLQGMVRVPTEGRQDVSAIYGGYVSGLTLIEGEAIRRGQVLFYLENPEFVNLQQSYLETQSQMQYLKAEYDRQQTLYSEQISAQKNFLKAEADFRTAEAKLAGLEQQLLLLKIDPKALEPGKIRSKIPVYSPINGFVESIHAVPGSYLNATDKALTLLNRDHLHVELIVYEKDARKLKIGQKVTVSIPDLKEDQILAEVYVISQSINSERQVMVHAHLVDESMEKYLVPGMYLEAKLDLEDRPSKVVPESAVVEVDGLNYILIQSEKTESGYLLEKVEVQIVGSQEGYLAIKPAIDLDESAVVLIKGAFGLV